MNMNIRHYLTSTGLRQSFLVVGGNTISAGVSALALIIFSRLLGPEGFGVFSVGFAIWQLIVRLSDGGVNIAIQKQLSPVFDTNTKVGGELTAAAVRLKAIIAVSVTLLGIGLTPLLARHLLHTTNTAIIYSAVITASVTTGFEFILTLLQTLQRFAASIVIALIQSFTKLMLAGILFIAQTKDALLAFTLYALGTSTGVLAGLKVLPSWLRTTHTTREAVQSVMKVAKYSSLAIIAAAISDNADVLLVKRYLTDYDTGLFAAGARLTMLISLFAYSLGTVLNPRAARYQQKYHFLEYAKKSSLLILFSLVSLALVPLLSAPLILLTAGVEYLPGVTTVNYLLSSGVILVATTPIIAMFYALNRPEYFALSGILQTVVLIVSSILLIPPLGINGAGIAKLLSRVVVLLFSLAYAFLAIKKQFNITLPERLAVEKEIEES